MRTIIQESRESYYAKDQPETEPFILDLFELMKKHKLAIVPVYDGFVSFHDGMRVVPLNNEIIKFIGETDVCFAK